MKKQFLRVKQIADQTFLRAEKTEVLTDDLLAAEKRVDSIKVTCQATQKKITSCQIDFGSETSLEKRLKKIPQINLGASMLESGYTFSKNSALGDTLKECATVQTKLGTELLEYCNEVEKLVLKPIAGILDNEIHNINKLRKQLGKLVLDMDSARTRFQTAERHSMQQSCNTNLNVVGKVDSLKEELEDASQKVEQCRDTLAAEMFTLISREPQLAQLLVQFHQLQATYHRNALAALESSLPSLENLILDFPQKPVYGCSLEEHLRVTNRSTAQVIETCINFLLEYGLTEEGLLRIAGSSTKLKKIKSSFDAGMEIDLNEFIRDPHVISGALKSYLRELPDPLMTFSLYDEWMNAVKIADSDSKLQALWQVIHKLPEANYKNLKCVILFLAKVNENMEVNKMSSQNIAIVMAPNLIWSPTDDDSTLGMNMSTASLHSSILDLLISYAEWFFPEQADPINKKEPDQHFNLNESKKRENTSEESCENTAEVNGNNLAVSNSIPSDCPSPSCSPRSPHKGLKKPAAPPPPAQKTLEKYLHEKVSLVETSGGLSHATMGSESNKLIDLSCEEQTVKMLNPNDVPLLNKRQHEASSTKSEKPVIPDKPGYNSLSLDRRSHRHSVSFKDSRGAQRTSEIISRPSVPPPERPVKPPKFSSSSENIFVSEEQSKIPKDSENVPSVSNICQKSPDMISFDEQSEDTLSSSNIVKTSPNTLHHSQSFSKGHRFDFLVNQKEEKPPERPPRSVGVTDGNAKPEALNLSSVPFDSSPPPVAPRTMEVEKVKPARPQPPLLPAKPKLLSQSENTNL